MVRGIEPSWSDIHRWHLKRLVEARLGLYDLTNPLRDDLRIVTCDLLDTEFLSD